MRTTFMLVVLAGALFAQSKEALKAQLAEMEKRHLADAKTNQELAVKLAGLQAGQRIQKGNIADTTAAVDAGRGEAAAASNKTDTTLEALRLDVKNNQAIAKTAAKNAETANSNAAAALTSARSSGINTFLTNFFSVLSIVLAILANGWVASRKAKRESTAVLVKLEAVHETAQEAVKAGAETKATVEQLEKNTNNKMDKLLETTGAAEFAKGRLKGAEDAKA